MGQIKDVVPTDIQSYGDMTVEFTDKWYQLDKKGMYYLVSTLGVFNQYRVVRENSTCVYILVPQRMHDEFTEICEEHDVSKSVVARPPVHEEAPCGLLTTKLSQHTNRCTECRVANGKLPAKPKGVQAGVRKRDGDVNTVFALPELREFSFDGLLDLMGKYRDEAMEIASSLDASITNVNEVRSLLGRLSEIREASPHLSAAMDHFLEVK